MSTSRARIPGSIPQFASYIDKTTVYLAAGTPETNASRLGILEPEQAKWNRNNFV